MSTPDQELLTACAQGDITKVRELISTMQTPSNEEASLKSMALKAAEHGHADILTLCIDEGADVSRMDLEDYFEYEEVLEVLVTRGGIDVNEDFEHAGDALINAIWEMKYDFSKWLLEHGADPNSGHLMADSTSAITAAAERGRIDFADLLVVAYGAEVSGSGALVAAAERKHMDMVRWLLDRGAEIDEIGVHDYGDRRHEIDEGSALHKAAANGDVEMAKLLVSRGASLAVKDKMDRTPRMRALEGKCEEMPTEEVKQSSQSPSSDLAVKVSTSFPTSEIFGIKLVNGKPTTAVLSIANSEPAPISVVFIGGSLWLPFSPTTSPAQEPRIVRNLTTTKYDNIEIAAGESESVNYKFATELQPQDLLLNLAVVVRDEEGGVHTLQAFNETVAIVEPDTSIFDPQILFLYLFLLALFAGTCLFIYNTWISTLFPSASKKRNPSSSRARNISTKGNERDQVGAAGADGPAVTSGAKAYDESWIPAGHLQRPEARR
ncbi:MAG: hypothetical protein Q9218_008052, partial [Villophora microphyllina]